MSKTKTVGLVIGAAGLLYWLSAKAFNLKQAIAKLTASNPRIKIAMRGLTITLDVTLDIINPASVDIPFEYYAGTVLYNNSTIGSFNYNYQGKAVTLKCRSATSLNFIVTISSIPIALQLKKIIEALYSGNKHVNTKLQVQSAIYAGGFDVPVNFTYDVRTQSIISGVGIVAGRRRNSVPLPPPPPPNEEEAVEGLYEFVL